MKKNGVLGGEVEKLKGSKSEVDSVGGGVGGGCRDRERKMK